MENTAITNYLATRGDMRASSIAYYRRVLEKLQKRCPGRDLKELSKTELLTFINTGDDGNPRLARTRNNHLGILKEFYRDMENLVLEKLLYAKPQKTPCVVTDSDIGYIIDACLNLRDMLLVALIPRAKKHEKF